MKKPVRTLAAAMFTANTAVVALTSHAGVGPGVDATAMTYPITIKGSAATHSQKPVTTSSGTPPGSLGNTSRDPPACSLTPASRRRRPPSR